MSPRQKQSSRSRKVKKPPRSATPVKDLSQGEEIQHYNAILIEEIRSEMKMVVEHVTTSEERIMARMDERFLEVDQSFDDVRRILSYHTELFRKNDERWQKNDERWQKAEIKLDQIASKLDAVVEKVEKHDVILKRQTA